MSTIDFVHDKTHGWLIYRPPSHKRFNPWCPPRLKQTFDKHRARSARERRSHLDPPSLFAACGRPHHITRWNAYHQLRPRPLPKGPAPLLPLPSTLLPPPRNFAKSPTDPNTPPHSPPPPTALPTALAVLLPPRAVILRSASAPAYRP